MAGDVKARSALPEQLPDALAAELVELYHGGRAVDGGDDVLAAEVQAVIRDRVVVTTQSAVNEVRDRMGHDRAVAGSAT